MKLQALRAADDRHRFQWHRGQEVQTPDRIVCVKKILKKYNLFSDTSEITELIVEKDRRYLAELKTDFFIAQLLFVVQFPMLPRSPLSHRGKYFLKHLWLKPFWVALLISDFKRYSNMDRFSDFVKIYMERTTITENELNFSTPVGGTQSPGFVVSTVGKFAAKFHRFVRWIPARQSRASCCCSRWQWLRLHWTPFQIWSPKSDAMQLFAVIWSKRKCNNILAPTYLLIFQDDMLDENLAASFSSVHNIGKSNFLQD